MSKEWIIGKNTVIEALQSQHSIEKVYMADHIQPAFVKKVKAFTKQSNTTLQQVPKKKLDQMVSGNHQGIAALVSAYEYADVEDLLVRAREKNEAPFFLILDEIEDPHNLGSILRTADATGVHGVIIPKRRSVGLTATVAKTSVGAIEHVPVARVTNIRQTIEQLKEEGVWVVGTAATASEDYRHLDGELPLALVIGNEGKGVSQLVLKTCDWTVQIPLHGHVSSLNASVASSLLMYEVYRNRYPVGES
ncbi:TrmH family RNA methyltransferase [Gracilibacillus halophilus YIM-C55.5]|uniref:TrmH family RNA methyltransferase n=1 Tax=Gracilibacillus halophilus YIM-C55.5 TaxID=1308866 RepID=N4WMX9_9BACI|nr:23S rRNA (guanosine(2251)-2'-O)-methyltransferase RlmB [Gracilibacillus halophilus]ENH95875.1 TrmH family RNA methyltransferase [Gracilibacillus halophilus YIM-C55.5]